MFQIGILSRNTGWLPAIASLALCVVQPALAQKSNDTLRMASVEPLSHIDAYHNPLDEARVIYLGVYDPLIYYDERNGKFVGALASKFTRISPTVLEFDLRQDVVFHNGNSFDADDVVATVNYVSDPTTKIIFKDRYDWARAEKIDKYKVRIISNQPNATDLSTLAYRFPMFDGETMQKYDNVSDYGRRTPVGTGAYRVAAFDTNSGVTTERVENHYDKAGLFSRAPIKRVRTMHVPDRQTQIAQLLTGNLDMLRNITPDDAQQFADNPAFKVTATSSNILIYITIDAAGRSANKIFTDPRVRKAFFAAIDRDTIIKTFVPGGDMAVRPMTICFESTIGCKPTTKPYEYNPVEAKRLLAEAGFPNGVDIDLNTFIPIKQLGEAIAGEIRKVGFRATVKPITTNVLRKVRGDGELTTYLGYYTIASHPDVANPMDFFFGADRNYTNDPLMTKITAEGLQEFDFAKRDAVYTPALDRINREGYIVPFSELPTVFAHTKEIKLLPGLMGTGEPRLGDYAWADN